MNFEFLKGIQGLEDIYSLCKDAEELALTRPYISVMTSRKATELLAGFLYGAVHHSTAENMNFAAVLQDKKVNHFMNDSGIIHAFHSLLKPDKDCYRPNIGVSQEYTIECLQKLYYVAGETVKRLNLIASYPAFTDEIRTIPDTAMNEVIEKRAHDLFLKYHLDQNEEEYTRHFVEIDLSNQAHRAYLDHGYVRIHEFLEFHYKPFYKSTIEYLERYLMFIEDMVLERSPEYHDPVYSRTVRGNITICIDGNIAYSGDIKDNEEEIYKKLEEADSFSVEYELAGDLKLIHGMPDSPYKKAINEDEVWQGRGLVDYLDSIKRREFFTYRMMVTYPDDGNITGVECIINGKTIDVPLICDPDFSHKLRKHAWTCESFSMFISFHDKASHDDILDSLHEAVLDFLPKQERLPLEAVWADKTAADGTSWLFHGNTFVSQDMSDVMRFIDRFNEIIAPVAKDCTLYFNDQVFWKNRQKEGRRAEDRFRSPRVSALMEGNDLIDPAIPDTTHCFICMEEFAVAAFVWKDHMLQIVGTIL